MPKVRISVDAQSGKASFLPRVQNQIRTCKVTEHPDYFSCEENGHSWQFTGEADDGTKFYRCRRCGAETEG